MPEKLSPLSSGSSQPAPASLTFGSVRLTEQLPGCILQLAGWETFEESVTDILASLGFSGPGNYRQAETSGHFTSFRIAPDKIWLVAEHPSFPTELNPQQDDLVFLDLSHSRTAFLVSGPGAEHLLARLAGIDFRSSSFPPGDFVQTGIHQIGVLIHRCGLEEFSILVPVTWAGSLWDYMVDTAKPFGRETA